MTAVRSLFRELREAVLTGAARAKDRLHQLTDNVDAHLDTVVTRVRDRDTYDGPGGGAGGPGGGSHVPGSSPTGSAPSYTHGVRFFGADQLKYYTNPNATLGAPGSAVFMMPAEDAVNVHDAMSAAIESGMAPSVTDAWRNGDTVYGALIPIDHLPQRLPTAADAGGFPHFLPGGQTAVNIGGVHFQNPTREIVVDGGTPLRPGTAVFELGDGGVWDILGIYG